MTLVPLFLGSVDRHGHLLIEDPARYRAFLKRLAGKPIELIVRKRRSQRSTRQNRYYWGVLIELLADECGYTPDEMHLALKAKFLPAHEDDPVDRRSGITTLLPTGRSTAGLSTVEFEQYLTRVREFAALELGVSIPEPNEVEMP